MESSAMRRRLGSGQEEGLGVQPRRTADLGMGPNLRHSHSSLKSRRSQAAFGTSEKQENLSSWILENIKKKACVHFVKSCKASDAGKVVCACGYTKEQHVETAKSHMFQDKEWDPKKHVQEMPTDAFGDIVFTCLGQKVGKYVRVSQDTPSSAIYHLMTKHWGLDVPSLLISVTGGAKDFKMKLRLKNIFRRGLVKVAQTTGAWIITGGSHAGVMKQVGKAVRDFSLSSSYKEGDVITIGVATWGTIHNRESLVNPLVQGLGFVHKQRRAIFQPGRTPIGIPGWHKRFPRSIANWKDDVQVHPDRRTFKERSGGMLLPVKVRGAQFSRTRTEPTRGRN